MNIHFYPMLHPIILLANLQRWNLMAVWWENNWEGERMK
ncbi:hypothetical protein F652_3567 [Enterobacteriaceae bacterium bta3-1]|nr:hypothetical protein F652_3567 [Enterobacteriaceae bacterium bta3-1]